MSVKKFFGSAEPHAHRQGDEALVLRLQAVHQGRSTQALDIFLRREDKVEIRGALHDSVDVRRRVMMMIRISHQFSLRIVLAHISHHILRSGDAAQHEGRTLLLHRRVAQSREMQLLERRQVETVIDHAHVYRANAVRALGHHHRVGRQRPARQVAQRAPRQHMIIDIEVVVRREEDGEAAAQGAVLHCIIEHHHIEFRQLTLQLLDPAHAVLAHRHGDLRELPMQLHRLVSDSLYGGLTVSQTETVRLALVPAREDRRPIAVVQEQSQQVLHHRRLSRAAHRQVTHAYRRHIDAKRG